MYCGSIFNAFVVKPCFGARAIHNLYKTVDISCQGGVHCSIVAVPFSMPESEDFLQICHSYKHLCDDFPAGSRRHITFLGGRVALNLAISNCLGTQVPHPIGRDIYGAPILPPGVAGSISHKNSFAVGIAAPSSEGCVRMLGVDIEEYSRERHQGIATRILTCEET